MDNTTNGNGGQFTISPVSVGWKCPVCGRGVAPFLSVCPCVPPTYYPMPMYPPYPWVPSYWPTWSHSNGTNCGTGKPLGQEAW